MLPDNQVKKLCREIFIFCSFQKMTILVKRMRALSNQSVTACQQQTRQVIKIPGFLEKGVNKT